MGTGASKGNGRGIVDELAHEGARVVAGSRTFPDELRALEAIGPVEVDLAIGDGPARLVVEAADGGIDVLVNNFGRFEARMSGIEAISDEQWQRSLDLNLLSGVPATRAAVPGMVQRGRGVIVNMHRSTHAFPNSRHRLRGPPRRRLATSPSCLQKSSAGTVSGVNSVSPGPTRTPTWQGSEFGRALAARAELDVHGLLDELPARAGITIGRLVEPAEVPALVAFLASDRPSGITGADYVVDGGLLKST